MRSAKKRHEILMGIHLTELGLTPFVEEFRFHASRNWRLDFAVPLKKLAIEIEGFGPRASGGMGRHQRPVGFQNDLEKYNTAAALGWRVFRFSVADVMNGRDIQFLRQALK